MRAQEQCSVAAARHPEERAGSPAAETGKRERESLLINNNSFCFSYNTNNLFAIGFEKQKKRTQRKKRKKKRKKTRATLVNHG